MSVTLIAVVIALLLGHFAQPFVAALRQYDWYVDWLRWLSARFGEGSAWRGRFGIAIALLPPLLVVGLFQVALDAPLLGLVGLLFAVAVLVYAWGPRDLDVDVDAITATSDPVARREAAARLWPVGHEPLMDGASLVEAVFRNALRRWFGVLFWFLLLGPVGALLYRLAVLSVEGESAVQVPSATAQGAQRLLAALDWPVAQLMTLSLALVGNFDTVLTAWREAGGASLSLANRFLGAVARASVRSELVEEASDYADDHGVVPARYMAVAADLPELRDAMSLVWRCLLVWLAVLALFVIAGWVS